MTHHALSVKIKTVHEEQSVGKNTLSFSTKYERKRQ